MSAALKYLVPTEIRGGYRIVCSPIGTRGWYRIVCGRVGTRSLPGKPPVYLTSELSLHLQPKTLLFQTGSCDVATAVLKLPVILLPLLTEVLDKCEESCSGSGIEFRSSGLPMSVLARFYPF